ncbi:MAG: hypothetical protein ACU0BB_01470 [Paracoccaceae bacterium]|jgi:hypothetical protein
MGIDRIINMVIRQLMRRVVNSGVNMGINAASGAMSKKGRKGRHQTPPDDYHVDEVQRRREM